MKYLPVDKCQEQQCSRETGILLPDVQRYPSYTSLLTHTCPLNCQCFFGETLVSSHVSTMCWHLPTLAQHIYRDFAYWLSTCMYKVHALNAGLLQDKSFNLIYCYAAKDKCSAIQNKKKRCTNIYIMQNVKTLERTRTRNWKRLFSEKLIMKTCPFFVKIKYKLHCAI